MKLSAFVSFLLVATTFAYPVTQNLQHDRTHTDGLLNVNAGSTDSGSALDISGRDLDMYKDIYELVHRDVGDKEYLRILPRAAGTVETSPHLNKKRRQELIAYLNNIPTGGVEVQFVDKQWRPWHGDNKSQAGESDAPAFHTESFTDGSTKWLTNVKREGEALPWIKYSSPEKEDAKTIVSALKSAVENYDNSY